MALRIEYIGVISEIGRKAIKPPMAMMSTGSIIEVMFVTARSVSSS